MCGVPPVLAPLLAPCSENMCGVPPPGIHFFCAVPSHFSSVPWILWLCLGFWAKLRTWQVPACKFKPSSSCILECGTPSWACFGTFASIVGKLQFLRNSRSSWPETGLSVVVQFKCLSLIVAARWSSKTPFSPKLPIFQNLFWGRIWKLGASSILASRYFCTDLIPCKNRWLPPPNLE